MKYYALFVNLKKNSKILNCRLLQIVGGASRVKISYLIALSENANLILIETKRD